MKHKPTYKEKDWNKVVRAGAKCVCSICGKTYDRHPYDKKFWEQIPYGTGRHYFIHKICDGSLVKL